MARSVRNAILENRTNRLNLPQATRHWRTISKGLALGYRRGKNGGTWCFRHALEGNKYTIAKIGIADDYRDADNIEVFSFFEAQDRAKDMAENRVEMEQVENNKPYTVFQAVDDYLQWFKANRKSYSETKLVCYKHILPKFGPTPISNLETRAIRRWHENLVTSRNLDDDNKIRSAKATANRILTVFKAALNFAYNDDRINSNEIWRKVKPFKNVDLAKIRFLTLQESTRLINACTGNFRVLVQAALLTGARYGELSKLDCTCYNPESKTVFIADSKSGKPRHIPLNDQGKKFFDRATVGKLGHELIFTKENHEPWRKNHQSRLMKEACEIAKISPPATFHHLRHTYASLLAGNNTPLQVISATLGHSDTKLTEKHYAHIPSSFVSENIRTNLPSFEIEEDNVISIASAQR